jgi:hypothetical protein
MASDLSPDAATKCKTGVVHLSSKTSKVHHLHFWVANKVILPRVIKSFGLNSGRGFDFISFTPYASKAHYYQHHWHYAPLEPDTLVPKEDEIQMDAMLDSAKPSNDGASNIDRAVGHVPRSAVEGGKRRRLNSPTPTKTPSLLFSSRRSSPPPPSPFRYLGSPLSDSTPSFDERDENLVCSPGLLAVYLLRLRLLWMAGRGSIMIQR